MNNGKNEAYNLVLAVSGPYGAGASSLTDELYKILTDWHGCYVEKIRVSELIKRYFPIIEKTDLDKIPDDDTSKRREILQNAGTTLRQRDPFITAKAIISEMSQKTQKLEAEGALGEIGTTVFLVDCLKNRNEVKLLRKVYGDEFYLVYIHASRESRWRREVDYKGWKEEERVHFEERDQVDHYENKLHKIHGNIGQEVGKLSAIADYYIVNNQNRENLKTEANRLLETLFGDGKNQPTIQERSMHIAYSASNRSYCLSRQVGAAIVDDNGNILGVGHNDVPKANGGLYTQEDGQNDKRCHLVGDRRCINDTNKQERFKDLEDEIILRAKIVEEKRSHISEAISSSKFSELTEFCRAVHAEMEALLSVARLGRGSTVGATMYVTTQPCHNCIKHVICAGIHKIAYLEPYPKSLGMELHSDAIDWDPSDDRCLGEKMLVVPYTGVAPHRYHDFFKIIDERKDKKGFYKRSTKSEQSNNPRFARNISPRTRKKLDENMPNPITAQELAYYGEFTNCLPQDGLS
ncbi:MAG: deaminase [Pseudomonadota bacterium]